MVRLLQILIAALGLFHHARGVHAESREACPADVRWQSHAPEGLGVYEILGTIRLGTRWADLPDEVRRGLESRALLRHDVIRSQWSEAALAAKEHYLLECRTPEMRAAINLFYQKSYPTIVPGTFDIDALTHTAFKAALVRAYLNAYATLRTSITYPTGNLPNKDWDGISGFDSIRLPEPDSYSAKKAQAADILAALQAVPEDALSPFEQKLRERVMHDARAHSAGAFSGDAYGGSDPQTICGLMLADYDIIAGYELEKRRPNLFPDDDAVLSEANALYLNSVPLRWVDIGTLNAAKRFCTFTGPALVKAKVGDPAVDNVAKGLVLLKSWWLERVASSPAAAASCTVYSADDRTDVWSAFSGDMQFDGTVYTMDGYRDMMEEYATKKQVFYRALAREAVREVFERQSVLTPDDLDRVLAIIDTENAFGSMPQKVGEALDAVQGAHDGPARSVWINALEQHVPSIGGSYADGEPASDADRRNVESMAEEVKRWIVDTHTGYPSDIRSFFDAITLDVNTTNNSSTVFPGDIHIGVGTRRTKFEYYSTIIHELRHAVNLARQKAAPDKPFDEGVAVEGSGVASESLLIHPFAKVAFDRRSYLLSALSYGIQDARFAATTAATLAKYYRKSCSANTDDDTIAYTKKIAESYGLTGGLADNLSVRAHVGSQYLQYILGGLRMQQSIGLLQEQIGPQGRTRLDPYVLFACELNTPEPGSAYAERLKLCVSR